MDCSKDHDLRVIYIKRIDDMLVDVVRWCARCGAIVIDRELDGQVMPGAVMKMRFPTSLRGGHG